MAGDGGNGRPHSRVPLVLALQPGGLAQLARDRCGLGERGEQGERVGGGDQDFPEHGVGRDLGRGGRGTGLAAPAGASRGLSHRHRAGGRPVALGWRRRAEGSHRGVGLGVRARQGSVAGGAPRADGRYHPRRGVEAARRVGRRAVDARQWCDDAARPSGARHRLRYAGKLCLRARLRRCPCDGGQGHSTRRRADRHAEGSRRHPQRQEIAPRHQGVHGGSRYRQAGVLQQPAQSRRRGRRWRDHRVPDRVCAPAQDRCGVPAAAVRRAADHPP
ncbi:hypothetical protein GO305_05016 [Ralstonia solanacearum]|nr:hypothetical protein [Ralstonia solanacearum]